MPEDRSTVELLKQVLANVEKVVNDHESRIRWLERIVWATISGGLAIKYLLEISNQ